MSNFHAISLQVKSYSYFPKLNDEVCTYMIWLFLRADKLRAAILARPAN